MKTRKLLKNLAMTLSGFALVAAVSCSPYQQQGAALGALGGAGLGALAGDDSGDVLTGAALGAAAGTGVAAYRENQANQNRQPPNNSSQQASPPAPRPRYTPPPPRNSTPPISQPSRTSSGSYPVATPSIKPNTVISPYPPYNVLDTTGARSGDKLCDPSTIPINPATGKQYVDSRTGLPDVKRGKYFIVP